MTVSKRAWNAHNLKRKAAGHITTTPEGGQSTGGTLVNPNNFGGNRPNSTFQSDAPAKPFTGKINYSAPTPFINTATGAPLKKRSNKKKR